MSLRIPLVATVVGALIIGGATTGTTLALWHDEASLTATQVEAGTMSLLVDGSSTPTFAAVSSLALNSGSTAGTPHTFTATLAAGGEGKNLRMRMFVDDVTTDSSDLSNGLEIALAGVADAASCPSNPPAGSYAPLSGANLVEVTDPSAVGVLPGSTRVLCVALRVKANAPQTTGGKTGSLTFNLRGQQVRP